MNLEEKKQQIKMVLVGLAEYYQTDLTPGQLAMYTEDLEDIELETLAFAIKQIRQNPANNFFPKPAIIREAIFGNDKDTALEAANKIIEAMGKFGWTNQEQAKEFMGDIAWDVVVREGGWRALCERTNSNELPILKAQWRELAKVVAVIKKQDNYQIGIENLKTIALEHKESE